MTIRRVVLSVLRAIILSRKNDCIHPKPPSNHLSFVIGHSSFVIRHLSLVTCHLSLQPLLWRGARGEANRVNVFRVDILNDNTKNSNVFHLRPTIEIVGCAENGECSVTVLRHPIPVSSQKRACSSHKFSASHLRIDIRRL